ncbi:alpha/beta hydrolase [Nonomuraea spiralis]|uniref:alpha/beta hydrolase n=1 Tax=Nonomuraea TaxID=83681 RepID=UPI000F78AAC1|nr:alpha/beta hydrolase [Nonomuraea sp. WAC 01424]RSM95248.1 alpha/beta hydrolase [Nonomuraea sp. WAC 01424]
MKMFQNLDPELAAALVHLDLPETGARGYTHAELARERDRMAAARLAGLVPDPAVLIKDVWVPGPEGGPDLRLRIHRPAGATDGPLPCVYWIHGGGMTFGLPEQDDGVAARFVRELRCVVASPAYRLAPEHPDPAPVEDCYAGLLWLAASEPGVDPRRIAIGGASAGAGLAAGVTLLSRDRGGPAPVFQALSAPMLDDRADTPSMTQYEDVLVIDRDYIAESWTALLGDRRATDAVSRYAAPARATDLSGLPPALVDVGELEVFRDETVLYALRLARAGVPTELLVYPGVFHGSEKLVPHAEITRRAVANRLAALRRAFHRP